MISESTQEFLQVGIERLYPGRWKEMAGGGASTIEAEGLGILVTHEREGGHLAFAAGVLGGVAFSPDLVRAVGKLNNSIVLGAYVLREGEPDYWMITYAIKMRYSWVEHQSRASAHLVFDALSAVPQFVERGIAEVSPIFGGEPWGVPNAWHFPLMDAF